MFRLNELLLTFCFGLLAVGGSPYVVKAAPPGSPADASGEYGAFRFTSPEQPSEASRFAFTDDDTDADSGEETGTLLTAWGVAGAPAPLDVPPPLTDAHPQPGFTGHPIPAPWVFPKNARVLATWVPDASPELGIVALDARTTLAFREFPALFVTPRFISRHLSGPSSQVFPGTDLPSRVYDVSVEATLFLPVNERWLIQLAVAPGAYSDFETISSDAFRITGRALAFYTKSPQLKLAVGFIYLDRNDIAALPAAGVIWTPNDDTKLEVLFPRPRLARRISQVDGYHGYEQWLYLAGELGGGTWAVERANSLDDVATYRDLRLLVGIEHESHHGPGWLIEAGYVFNRSIEYESEVGDIDLNATGLVRFGWTY